MAANESITKLLRDGQADLQAGRYAGAVASFSKALRLSPDTPEILVPLSRAYAALGEIQQALDAAQQAFDLAPEAREVLENAAAICFQAGKINAVIGLFERLTALFPEEGKYLNDLALLYQQTHEYERAYVCMKKVFEGKEPEGEDLLRLGELAFYARRLEQAEAYFQKAAAANPASAIPPTFLGRCRVAYGDLEGAKTCFRRAITADPTSVNAYFHLSEIAPFKAGDKAFATLEGLKTSQALDQAGKSTLGFALGRMYQEIGEFDRAFENFVAGNAAAAAHFKAQGYAFDGAALSQMHQAVTSLFGGENQEKFTAPGRPAITPVFIIGMPRSGTTLLERMLCAHTDLSTAGELTHLGAVQAGLLAEAGEAGSVKAILKREGPAMAGAYLAELAEKGGGTPYVIDKMPFNFEQLGLISALFPNARVIHMRRDPRDVGLSIFCNQFFGTWAFSHDLQEIGFYYRLYHALMARWGEVLDFPVHQVRFEDLIEDPKAVCQRVLQFCGLEWQDPCLEFYRQKGEVFTTSGVGVRRPVEKSARGKWRHYEKHLTPLLKALEGIDKPKE